LVGLTVNEAVGAVFVEAIGSLLQDILKIIVAKANINKIFFMFFPINLGNK
jgi:hypothetical protein